MPKSFMLTLAALVLAAGARAQANPTMHAIITVESVSPNPCCGSGVIEFFVDLTTRTRKGDRLILSVYYMGKDRNGKDQPFPEPGDVCRVTFERHTYEMFADGTPRLVVMAMSCKTPKGGWRTY
ncbi:MAG TPA: hypothetical protein VHZ78_15140 [Rhizomicrobium sp.]|jgi:hypothetical protein|nr:hypothetical protein [Rhizomicrobium sp.]